MDGCACRHVVVPRASPGIGPATAPQLATAGHRVFVYEDGFRRHVTEFTGHLCAGSSPRVVAEAVSRALTAGRREAGYLVGRETPPRAVLATNPAPIGNAIRHRLFHPPAPGSTIFVRDNEQTAWLGETTVSGRMLPGVRADEGPLR